VDIWPAAAVSISSSQSSRANVDMAAQDLATGAVVVLGDDWSRIRRLPILPR
jgi:hypothetical protein